MLRTNFYPLRSIVGPSVPILSIELATRLSEAPDFNVISLPSQSGGLTPQTLDDKVDLQIPNVGNIYEKFLPIIKKNTAGYRPGPGMATMPIPDVYTGLGNLSPVFDYSAALPDIPFALDASVGSIFGFKTRGFQSFELAIDQENNLQQNVFLSNAGIDFTFAVTLAEEALIGGICLNGYPYITSRIEEATGMTLGNFGLPREIRLTPLPSSMRMSALDGWPGYQRNQFIDSEFTYVRQEIISHSGLNYLCIDPIRTNRFLLTITDLPFIINEIDLDASSIDFNGIDRRIGLRVSGYKGFAIPWLYFFEYRESTRRNARIHSGILGHKSQAFLFEREPDLLKLAFPEFEFYPEGEKLYDVFTPHSASGQRRIFGEKLRDTLKGMREMFVSDVLQPTQRLILYLQQGEEYERCIAGLRMLFPMFPPDETGQSNAEFLLEAMGADVVRDSILTDDERKMAEEALAYLLYLPSGVNFCEQIRVRIFGIEPLEGVSPASVELHSKYATLLADVEINEFFEVGFSYFLNGIPFRKISSSKYFAIELINTGRAEGQIVIHSMHLVRSAHVSLQPKASKTQQVKAMHYRIIGPELADDFSQLGNEGFNFSIDRVVASQTKDVLYSATSLLDLLHTGGARLQSNARRRAVEFEMLENFQEPPKDEQEVTDYQIKTFDGDDFSRANVDRRTTQGWRRSETGQDVKWDFPEDGPEDLPSIRTLDENGLVREERQSAFDSYGTTENRIHSELLFPDTGNVDWATISVLGNLLKLITDPTEGVQGIISRFNNGGLTNVREFIDRLSPDGLLIKTYRSTAWGNMDHDQLVKDSEKIWRGIDTANGNLRVNGLINSSQSPVGLSAIAGDLVGDVISSLDNLSSAAEEIKAILGAGDLTRIEDLDLTQLSSLDFTRLDDLARNLSGFLDLVLMLGELAVTSGTGVSPLAMVPLLNGLSLGLTSGVGVNISSGPNLIYPSYQMVGSSGSTGAINKSASKTGYSYSQILNVAHDKSTLGNSEIKRIVTRREVLNRDRERVRGAEVMWQNQVQDIITGTIPLNFTLPATATKMNFRTADDSLRVRFNSGFSSSIQVDFWFEVTEETIRDDY